MYWLYGAYIVSIFFTLLIEITKKHRISQTGTAEKRYYNPILVFLYICPLTYVAACRYRFWDTGDYRLMYEAIGTSVGNVFNNTVSHVEKGYLLFTVFLNRISSDSQILIIVSSIFILFSIIYFIYKESRNLPLSLVVFSSQIWMTTMNGLRQYMVVAALLLVWRKWSNNEKCRRNDLFFVIVIVLMSTFHRSVLICIPIFFCARGKLFNKKVLMCMIIAIIMTLVSPVYKLIFKFLLTGTEYVHFVDTNATMGSARFLISCLPIIVIFINHKIHKKNGEDQTKKIIWIMNLSCINFAFNILALKMVYFARIGMYFSIFDLIIIPYCIDRCFTKKSRILIKISLAIFYLYFFYKQIAAYGGYASEFQLFYEVC